MHFLIILFSFYSVIAFSQEDSNVNLKTYKDADMIFTGVLKSKYQLPKYNECDEDNRFLLEFDLTEIQKGQRHMKMLTETPDSSLKLNKEYLIFVNKLKKDNYSYFVITYYSEVCLGCENKDIMELYKIINKRIFATIKEPLNPENLIPKGCGCH